MLKATTHKEPWWENMSEATARYFYGPSGKPQVREPQPPPPPLTPSQKRAQKKAAELQKKEDRRVLVLFHANKRRAAKLHRTPPWADLDSMRALYSQARRLTLETGIPHHVDHVIPLQGRLVSGLHVPQNMQVLPASENIRKRNRYEV